MSMDNSTIDTENIYVGAKECAEVKGKSENMGLSNDVEGTNNDVDGDNNVVEATEESNTGSKAVVTETATTDESNTGSKAVVTETATLPIEEPSEEYSEGEEDYSEDEEYPDKSVDELTTMSKEAFNENKVCKAYHIANLAVLRGVQSKKTGDIDVPAELRSLFLYLGKVIVALLESKSDILGGIQEIAGLPDKEAHVEDGDMELHPGDMPTEDDVWTTLEIARTLYGRILKDVKGNFDDIPQPENMDFLSIKESKQGISSPIDKAPMGDSDVSNEITEGSELKVDSADLNHNIEIIQKHMLSELDKCAKNDGFYSFMENMKFENKMSDEVKPVEGDVKCLSMCFMLLGDLLTLGDHFVSALAEYERSFYCLIYYGIRDTNLKVIMMRLAQALLWSQRPKDALYIYTATVRLLEGIAADCEGEEKAKYTSIIDDVNVEIQELKNRPEGAVSSDKSNESLTTRIQALKTAIGNISTNDSGTIVGFAKSNFEADVSVQEMVPSRSKRSLPDGADEGTDKRAKNED